MLKGGETVLVAVSGGPDSLCLLHVLARLAPAFEPRSARRPLRPPAAEGSARDADVRRTQPPRGSGLPARRFAPPTATVVPRGRSPEEAARDRRYAFLDETADARRRDQDRDRPHARRPGRDRADARDRRDRNARARRHPAGPRPRDPAADRAAPCARPKRFCRRAAAATRGATRPTPIPRSPATPSGRSCSRSSSSGSTSGRPRRSRGSPTRPRRGRSARRARGRCARAGVVPGGLRFAVDRLLGPPAALQRRVDATRRAAARRRAHRARAAALPGRERPATSVRLPSPLNATLSYGSLLLGRATPDPAAPPGRSRSRSPASPTFPSGRCACGRGSRPEPPRAWPDGRRVCVLDAARDPSAARRASRAPRRPVPSARHDVATKRLGDFFTDAKVPRSERDRVPVVDVGRRHRVGGGSPAGRPVQGHRRNAPVPVARGRAGGGAVTELNADIDRILVTDDEIQSKVARARQADLRGLPRHATCSCRRPEGRVHADERPRAAHHDPARARLHGGVFVRVGDQDQRDRADHEGPRPRHLGPRRPDHRGHHRLGADAVVSDEEPAGRRSRPRSRSARSCRNPRSRRSRSTSGTTVSRSRRSSWWDTASTTASVTGICPTWVHSSPTFTRTDKGLSRADGKDVPSDPRDDHAQQEPVRAGPDRRGGGLATSACGRGTRSAPRCAARSSPARFTVRSGRPACSFRWTSCRPSACARGRAFGSRSSAAQADGGDSGRSHVHPIAHDRGMRASFRSVSPGQGGRSVDGAGTRC